MLKPEGVAVNVPAAAPPPSVAATVPVEPAQLLPAGYEKAADCGAVIVTDCVLLLGQGPLTA